MEVTEAQNAFVDSVLWLFLWTCCCSGVEGLKRKCVCCHGKPLSILSFILSLSSPVCHKAELLFRLSVSHLVIWIHFTYILLINNSLYHFFLIVTSQNIQCFHVCLHSCSVLIEITFLSIGFCWLFLLFYYFYVFSERPCNVHWKIVIIISKLTSYSDFKLF